MTDREKLHNAEEKLVELLKEIGMLEIEDCLYTAEYLIAHGVTIKEPNRPLTLEELFTAIKEDRSLYVEDIVEPTNTGWDNCNAVDYWINEGINKYEMRDDYGKHWRCWAEKPTEEERKAAEWEK